MKRSLVSALAAAVAVTSLAARPYPAAAGPAGEEGRLELEARLARAELLAGLTSVEGPGLVVKLRNSPHAAPKGVDRKALQVHEQDFNAILSVIRAAGAEAIAIGGSNSPLMERVTNATAAREGWNGLVVHGVALQQPYRILAIGDAARLRGELLRDGGIVRKAGLDVLQMIELEDSASLTLPAARMGGDFRYARASSGEPSSFADATGAETPAPMAPVRPVETRVAAAPLPPVTQEAPAEPKIGGVVRRGTTKPVRGSVQPQLETSVPEPVKPEPVKPEVKRDKPVADKKVETPRPEPRPVSSAAVFGGKGLAKYHLVGCRYGERIEAGQRVVFSSAQEAVSKGRTPCPVCHP